MRNVKLIFTLFALILISSCKEDALEVPISQPGKTELRSSSSLAIQEWFTYQRIQDTIQKDNRLPDSAYYQHVLDFCLIWS